MKATLERLVELESQFDQLDKEALRANEQFQATFIQATSALNTSRFRRKANAPSERDP